MKHSENFEAKNLIKTTITIQNQMLSGAFFFDQFAASQLLF